MFEYLKKYVVGSENRSGPNIFYPVLEDEILEAEKKLGTLFPSQLRQFYKEIGCGNLYASHDYSGDCVFSQPNEILPPYVAANFAKEILEWDNQKYWMDETILEEMESGDLPFFEIGDSSSFMMMKLNSDNPNAVWFMGKEKVEDSLEKFIYNLYYDDPSYYSRKW